MNMSRLKATDIFPAGNSQLSIPPWSPVALRKNRWNARLHICKEIWILVSITRFPGSESFCPLEEMEHAQGRITEFKLLYCMISESDVLVLGYCCKGA